MIRPRDRARRSLFRRDRLNGCSLAGGASSVLDSPGRRLADSARMSVTWVESGRRRLYTLRAAGRHMPTGSETGLASPGPTGEWLDRFNAPGLGDEERYALLVERFASVGEHALIRPPFFCDHGYNISLGPGAFLNYNCIILDAEPVLIGEGTAIGPAVQILAADHPRDPRLRKQKLRFG